MKKQITKVLKTTAKVELDDDDIVEILSDYVLNKILKGGAGKKSSNLEMSVSFDISCAGTLRGATVKVAEDQIG
tara:strand:+ start:9685 stop:9906 length:222 start_codon:yes stop_codon:yes gene_type:complete